MTNKRWLIAALVLSVVVNIALIGYLAGRASVREFGPPPLDTALGAGRLLRELPDARRETLRPLLHEHIRELRPNLHAIRTAQAEIRAAIVAEPFEAETLEAALARFQRLLGTSQARGNASLVAFIAALEPAERVLLVERIGRPPREPKPGYRTHRDDAPR
jgi:uncharacterized membrane protein